MRVVNLMERITAEVLDEQWPNINVPCHCDVCKNDVLALALNMLPTRYVTNDKGRLIVQLRMSEEQASADILREIAKAGIIVGAKPSHVLT
ncbi:MAG: late competence development ComFB family protein [Tumebacillaceae bacterium]